MLLKTTNQSPIKTTLTPTQLNLEIALKCLVWVYWHQWN